MRRQNNRIKLVDRSIGEHGWFNYEEIKPIENFIEQHRPPTFDEVVKVWSGLYDFDISVIEKDGEIEISNGINYWYISISGMDMSVRFWGTKGLEILNAINLTIRYLEAQKEKENG